VIADELSFIHHYYYSPVAILYSNTWVGILNMFVSLLSIDSVLCMSMLLSRVVRGPLRGSNQIFCRLWCPGFVLDVPVPLRPELIHRGPVLGFGNVYYDWCQ
jgi:hypothetical protein